MGRLPPWLVGFYLAAKRGHYPIARASQIWRRSWAKDGWQETRAKGGQAGADGAPDGVSEDVLSGQQA
ncbi:hypothetical protein PF003_g4253 [Phytophthora fragariae]|nr:hypothetical protein PF003_g4253 [Phytophthora fragariae]